MRILVIQFDADKGPGLLAPPLVELGCDVEVRLAPEEPLSLDGVDGLVVLGGLANPDDDIAPVRVARALCAEALATATPVLGICLGAELLAQAAGHEAPRCPAEFGFHTVRLEPGAADDPLLRELPESFDVFEAHGYTWEPPAGSTVLAHTGLTRQAYHLPPLAWGLQFHFEADASTLEHLATSEPTRSVFAGAGVDLDDFVARTPEVTASWVEGAGAIARGFVGVIEAARAGAAR